MSRGLKKGQCNNRAGKPKGTKNKITKPLKESLNAFLTENFEVAVKEWSKLKGRDKLNFYASLLKYSLPQIRDIKADVEHTGRLSILDLISEADRDNEQ